MSSIAVRPLLWNRHALLTCEEMRQAETLSCARGTHGFYDLMRVAGAAVARAVVERFDPCRVLVLCGTGNNGGDGYVAATILRQAGWPVHVSALGAATTDEARKAAEAWGEAPLPWLPELLDEADLVVDALFGTGLTRPLEGAAAGMVKAVGASGLPVVAADMPRGMNGDTGAVMGCAIKARATVTFFRKKRGHVLMPAKAYCGEVVVADTGLFPDVLDQVKPLIAENNIAITLPFYPKLELDAHKYKRGHVLGLGGAVLTGASRLAARAAQRMGAGLVSLAVPQAAWSVYAGALESVMVQPWQSVQEAQEKMENPKVTTLFVGPGLGLGPQSRELVLAALATKKPCVLDADGLMVFEGESRLLIDSLRENCVITPHEGEFGRLFGALSGEKAGKVAQTAFISGQTGCVVLHKGADTVISSPDGVTLVNTNAPPVLATAGAGDVLAGMIAGAMAGGMPPFLAAGFAAHLHGRAGQVAGRGLIAEDLIALLPSLLKAL